jgi:peptidoglycan hydrolase-like protein with peptidoglycan-binding domain
MGCGIVALDRLWTDAAAPSIAPTDRESVAAVQALLLGHGFSSMPTVLSRDCGVYGPQTIAALQTFQSDQDLGATGTIDRGTLQALAKVPAKTPVVSSAYAAFVLEIPGTGLLRPATITMMLEGGGRFAAVNWNSDRAGLSFGLIQWAQRPGRLHEVLAAFQRADPDRFVRILGAGDSQVAQGLVLHTGGMNGGVDRVTGLTRDPHYDLIAEPWRSRFLEAGRDPVFQRVQISTALAAFTTSAKNIQLSMPLVVSERALAFMLDVANQFGDTGARSVVSTVMKTLKTGASETDFLSAVGGETVARIARQFGAASKEVRSTSNRREVMKTTPWLTDTPAVFT